MIDPFSSSIAAWNSAGREFNITVEAPFVINVGGVSATALAFLPEFGTQRGMVIDAGTEPHFYGNREIEQFAKDNGLFYTIVNLERYASFDKSRFQDALRDWGYFGSKRLDWLNPTVGD